MIVSGLAQMVLIGGLFAAACAPALMRPGVRRLALLLCALAMLDWASLFQFFVFHLRIPGAHWNWVGKLFELGLLSTVAALPILTSVFNPGELGLRLRQAPGTYRAVALVALPFLGLVALTSYESLLGDPGPPPGLQAIAYQATLPGLTEELGYRGVFLAILDRLFPPTVNVLGARMGYGAAAGSVVFGLLHAVAIDPRLHMDFQPIAFATAGATGLVLCWIRTRSGSLVLPVLVHNATNLILILVRPA